MKISVKNLVIIAVILTLGTQTYAESLGGFRERFVLGTSFGFGFALPIYGNTTMGVDAVYASHASSKKDEVEGSLGKGAKFDITADIYMKKNFAATVIVNMSAFGKYEVKETAIVTGNSQSSTIVRVWNDTYTVRYIAPMAGLKYAISDRKVGLYIYGAAGVAIARLKGEYTIEHSADGGYADFEYENTVSYSPAFIGTIGVGAELELNEHVGLTWEVAPFFGEAKTSEDNQVDIFGNSLKESEYGKAVYNNLTLSNLALKMGLTFRF